MFAMQYEHRLPADYDMQVIRDRAATRGPLWDATPGLVLKAFVARTRGQGGSHANLYGSVYLWQDAASAMRLLTTEKFRIVTDSFGRPQVPTWLPLDALAGPAAAAGTAKTLYRDTVALASNADIAEAVAAAAARNRATAKRADTVAAWVVLDSASWQLVWFTLSSAEPDLAQPGEIYQVWYLAGPGIAALPSV
ncbi:DUF4865 family protein [Pigmentiphaga aceris]|uniref:DUF4865 family protein n=1 Tax=Pigmentiphaga aceris TaxID=1940612 RepID=A0A5C0B1R3_9BURK|nr:DUF4865 family protein [Pigmentiphaga aceris]QEI08739.1 DUF4865 family protein [Pigmentiphaga aceris]